MNEFALHASVADMLALLNMKSSPEEWVDALSCVSRDTVDATPNFKVVLILNIASSHSLEK